VAPEEHQLPNAEARFAPRRLGSIRQAEVAEWKEVFEEVPTRIDEYLTALNLH